MGDRSSRTLARPLVPVAAAGALLLALAGCGTAGTATPAGASPGAPTDPSTRATYGWFAYAGTSTGDIVGVGGEHGVPGPVDAVERADLRLPAHADVRQVSTQTFTGYAESYLFVFRLPDADAVAFCDQGGLGGARLAPNISGEIAEGLGHPAVTTRSRWCASPAPTDPRWSRYAVIVAGAPGAPATVHLLLRRAP